MKNEIGEVKSLSLQRFWEGGAPFWSRRDRHFLNSPNCSEDREVIRRLLQKFFPRLFGGEGRILDLGSGGAPEIYFPDESLARVVAFDIAGKTLTQNRAGRKVLSDFRDGLPFTDESFTAVTAFFANRYMRDQEKVLLEAVRVLRSGGLILCIDFGSIDFPVQLSTFNPFKLSNGIVGRALSKKCAKVLLPGQYSSNPDLDGFYGLYLFAGVK